MLIAWLMSLAFAAPACPFEGVVGRIDWDRLPPTVTRVYDPARKLDISRGPVSGFVANRFFLGAVESFGCGEVRAGKYAVKDGVLTVPLAGLRGTLVDRLPGGAKFGSKGQVTAWEDVARKKAIILFEGTYTHEDVKGEQPFRIDSETGLK